MNSKQLFKWKYFQVQGEIIILCVRWYLRYALSYRNLKEIMMERGLSVDHTTIYGSVAKSFVYSIGRRCTSVTFPTTPWST